MSSDQAVGFDDLLDQRRELLARDAELEDAGSDGLALRRRATIRKRNIPIRNAS